MRCRRSLLLLLIFVTVLLPGCIYPEPEQSEWRWKQYNREYRPLPGDREL